MTRDERVLYFRLCRKARGLLKVRTDPSKKGLAVMAIKKMVRLALVVFVLMGIGQYVPVVKFLGGACCLLENCAFAVVRAVANGTSQRPEWPSLLEGSRKDSSSDSKSGSL